MFYIKYIRYKNQKGVSIYLAIMISSIILAIALGISVILFSQKRITSEIGSSVTAFYAADTGIERILYDIREGLYDPTTCSSFPCPGPSDTLPNGAAYSTYTRSIGPIKVQSVGSYQEVKRAIEISY